MRLRARWKNAKEDNQFPVPTLAKTLQDYQDPAKCDKITQINTQIDETKNVLVMFRRMYYVQNRTIDSVLERGTKLDDLVGKSNDLSDHILFAHCWSLTFRVEDVLQAGKENELMLYDHVSLFMFICLLLYHLSISHAFHIRQRE